jgi:hypothetical protein
MEYNMAQYIVHIVFACAGEYRSKALIVNTFEQAENMLYEIYVAKRKKDKSCLLQALNCSLVVDAEYIEYAEAELQF